MNIFRNLKENGGVAQASWSSSNPFFDRKRRFLLPLMVVAKSFGHLSDGSGARGEVYLDVQRVEFQPQEEGLLEGIRPRHGGQRDNP